jgi:hypothetical protein
MMTVPKKTTRAPARTSWQRGLLACLALIVLPRAR